VAFNRRQLTGSGIRHTRVAREIDADSRLLPIFGISALAASTDRQFDVSRGCNREGSRLGTRSRLRRGFGEAEDTRKVRGIARNRLLWLIRAFKAGRP